MIHMQETESIPGTLWSSGHFGELFICTELGLVPCTIRYVPNLPPTNFMLNGGIGKTANLLEEI